MERGITRTTYS